MVHSLTSCIVMGTLAKIAHQLLKSGFSQNTDLWWSIWLNLWDRYQHNFAMDNNEHTTLPLLARTHVCNPRATVIWCTFFSRLIQVEECRNCFNNVPVNVPLPSDPYRSWTVPVSRHWTPTMFSCGCSADRRRNPAQTSALSSKCAIQQFEVHKCPGAASLPHCPQRSEVTTQWLTSSGNLGWILHSNRNSRWWYSLGSTVGPFSRDLLPCWWDRSLMVVPCNSQTAMYQVLDASLSWWSSSDRISTPPVAQRRSSKPAGSVLVLEYAGWGLDLDTPRTPAKPEGADGAEDADGAGAAVDGATLTDVDRVEVTSGSPSLSDDTTTVSATTLSTSSSRRSNNGWKRLGRFHAKHSPRYLNSGLRKALPPRFSPLARKNLCTKLSLSREHETLPLVHTTQKHR